MNKIACIIPARLKSTRFPRKMVASLAGKPILEWVWQAAKEVALFDTITFAIDSPEVASLIESFGGTYHMTSPDCRSGTMRLAELHSLGKIKADIWVNWQGDEPFIHTAMIKDLLQSIDDGNDIWTLKKKVTCLAGISSPHIAKVVTDSHGRALYFSRSTIPFHRDIAPKEDSFFKHIGIYAFTSDALAKISSLEPSFLEEAEQLEQLSFLYHGLKLRVHETQHDVFGIDLPEHLAQAEQYLAKALS
jgi:3-deoxy-manno-octulosonate cytidylyltransferase (CMP-KDO synthetase)